jgi:transposase-like protein
VLFRSGAVVRFRRCGAFHRRTPPRRVQRFRCGVCGRSFSQQSFACSYYLKRPELLLPVAAGLVAGSAHRQLARSLGCAPSTVTRLAPRLGRHALLLQARLLAELTSIDETIAYDDFETFSFAQYFPFALGTAVGQRSAFLYAFDQAPHRRGGALSPAQQRRQRQLDQRFGRPPRAGRQRAFRRVLDLLLARAPSLSLVSDGHPAYRGVVARHPHRERVRHRGFPNPHRGPRGTPRSPAARERDRELFPVDQLHRLIRHSQAHHRRETIAFGRSRNALCERAALLAVWRNLVKPCSERRPARGTPAMLLGLTDRRWSWRAVLARRLFPAHIPLPEGWRPIHHRDLVTPPLGPHRPHELRHAL